MNKALILIDIQNDYFDGGANPLVGSENAGLNAKKILDKFRADHTEIIYIQHIATSHDSTFFLSHTVGCLIHEYVKPVEGEKIIVKHFPNSFRETELLDVLKMKDITDLVICGMMTHMCVDATTRAAKDFGFKCTLIGDACATKDLEINGRFIHSDEVHYAFLAALNNTYATVKTTSEYLSEIQY